MKNILLIGAGHFGRHIAMQLSQLGHQVMAVDTDEERINDVLPFVTKAQIGDSTNAEFLRALGIRNFDVCFVTISGNFQNSLETTSLLKELGAKCVVSRAERDVQAKFLLRNGADNVVYPEKQMAIWAAKRYTADHIFDYIEIDKQHAIFEVEVPKAWVGKSIGMLDVRKKFGINILGIKRLGKTDVSITPDTVLSEDITMLAGILLQLLLNYLNYSQYIDKRIIDRTAGTLTDYLVSFGVATIKISVVAEFWQLIAILSVIGVIIPLIIVFVIGKKLFQTYWFERSIFIFGYLTGIVAVGITLLRSADPDMKSGTLEDFGLAYTLQSVIEVFLVAFIPLITVYFGCIETGLMLSIIGILFYIICYYMYKNKTEEV